MDLHEFLNDTNLYAGNIECLNFRPETRSHWLSIPTAHAFGIKERIYSTVRKKERPSVVFAVENQNWNECRSQRVRRVQKVTVIYVWW